MPEETGKSEETTEPTIDSGSENINPSWQEILDVIPDNMHPLLIPKLKEWDDGVKEKVNKVKEEFSGLEPYKVLAEQGVPFDQIEYGLGLINALEANPQEVVADAIKTFGLDFVAKAAAEASTEQEPYEVPEGLEGFDITKHPDFIKMQETLNSLSGTVEAEKTAKEEAEATKAFEKSLDELQEKHKDDGEFDRLFVSALMVNGYDGERAVKQYYDTVNQAAAKLAEKIVPTNTDVPIVLGGAGSTGSGLPAAPVSMGAMSSKDTRALVMDFIARSNAENANDG
jgi:hypothetical protein